MGRVMIYRWTCTRCGTVEELDSGHPAETRPERWADFSLTASFGPTGPEPYLHPRYDGVACGDCAHLIRTLWLRKDKP